MEKKQGIVDRIEGNILVVEIDKKMQNIQNKYAVNEIVEGDVVDIIMKDNVVISVKKNEEETISRKEYIKKITKDMWK